MLLLTKWAVQKAKDICKELNTAQKRKVSEHISG